MEAEASLQSEQGEEQVIGSVDNSSKKFYHERTKRVGGSIHELGEERKWKRLVWCRKESRLGCGMS